MLVFGGYANTGQKVCLFVMFSFISKSKKFKESPLRKDTWRMKCETTCSIRKEGDAHQPSDLVFVQRQTFLEQHPRDFDTQFKFWICHFLALCPLSSSQFSQWKNRVNNHTLSQGRSEMLINEKCLEYCLAHGEHHGIANYYYHPVFCKGKLDLVVKETISRAKRGVGGQR